MPAKRQPSRINKLRHRRVADPPASGILGDVTRVVELNAALRKENAALVADNKELRQLLGQIETRLGGALKSIPATKHAADADTTPAPRRRKAARSTKRKNAKRAQPSPETVAKRTAALEKGRKVLAAKRAAARRASAA